MTTKRKPPADAGGSGQEVSTRYLNKKLGLEPRNPSRGPVGRPPTDWWTVFTAAAKKQGRTKRWVLVAEWKTRQAAHKVRRRVLSGDVDVPGGAEAWEVAVRELPESKHGQLWVRQIR